MLLSGALAGLGFENFQSIAQVSSISMVSSERYAQATSTFYIFFDLGIGMAPYISGYAVPYAGYDGVFGLNAIVVAAAIAGYAVLQASGRLARRPSRGKTIALKDGCE